MVAPLRVGSETTNVSSSDRRVVTFTHTTTSDTELLLILIGTRGDDSAAKNRAPYFNASGGTLTGSLVLDTGAAAADDQRIKIYEITAPPAGTFTLSYSFSPTLANPDSCALINYDGVGATPTINVIDTDVNVANAQNSSLTQGVAAAGNTYLAIGSFRGADGDPASMSSTVTYSLVFEVETGGGSGTNDHIFNAWENRTNPSDAIIVWAVSDENTGALIEIVADGGAPVAVTARRMLMGIGR